MSLALVAGAAGGSLFLDWWHCLPDGVSATYIGRDELPRVPCPEYDLWQGSHHDLAMDLATPETVLGDFNDAEFEQFGIRSRMFRRGGKFFVHTEGPDGKLADFEVKYVLGVTPLQNYMVEFDRPADMPEHEIARLQVLRITWDTLAQTWFYMPPPDVRDQRLAPDDDLHWTGMAQRWNNMCADCHSTNLQKNFDVATRTYHTTFSEIDVSCEACHGPGQRARGAGPERIPVLGPQTGLRLGAAEGGRPEAQMDTCAPCHSRRGAIHAGFPPGDDYHDYFVNELLSRETYHRRRADPGRGLRIRLVPAKQDVPQGHQVQRLPRSRTRSARSFTGNAVCTSCHQHPAGQVRQPGAPSPPARLDRRGLRANATCRRRRTWRSIRGWITASAFRGRT